MYKAVIFSKVCAGFSASKIAEELGLNPQTTLVVRNVFSALQFQNIRSKRLAKYPCISEPQYKLSPNPNWRAIPLDQLLSDEQYQHHSNMFSLPPEEVRAAIENAEFLIYAMDQDSWAASSVQAICQQFRGAGEHISHVKELQWKKDGLTLRAVEHATFKALAEKGLLKRYFEWNFFDNAKVVYGRALEECGGARVIFSKYAVQTFYAIAARIAKSEGINPYLTDGEVIRLLGNWKGSGKYEPASLGSVSSHTAILEQLTTAKLLDFDKPFEANPERKRYQISAIGQAFLKALHPENEDKDLPGRINLWQGQGFVVAKPAMDRYIRTVFGRQLKFEKNWTRIDEGEEPLRELIRTPAAVLKFDKANESINTMTDINQASYLEVDAGVRYWEDATLNGVADESGNMPLREGEAWQIVIDLQTGQILEWPVGNEASIHYKVCDAGYYWLLDNEKRRIAKWRGHYVPGSAFGNRETDNGDYIIFNITRDGLIDGWQKPYLDPDRWVPLPTSQG